MSAVQGWKMPRQFAAQCVALLVASVAAAVAPRAAASGPYALQFQSSYFVLNESPRDVGTHPVAVGDVNNDHALDMVVARGGVWGPYNNVAIYFGDGYGNFSPPVGLDGALPRSINGVYLADLNRDGRLDLVVSDYSDTLVYFRLGHGDGTFGPTTTVGNSFKVNSVSVGDMNEDGIPDLVLGAGPTGSGFSILLGDGSGHFALSSRVMFDNTSQGVLTDMNGDGHLDVVGGDLVYDAGDGHGAIAEKLAAGGTTGGISVAVTDLDGDGNKDIISASADGWLYFRYGQAGGVFVQGSAGYTRYWFGDHVRCVMARDLDGDGRAELIVGGAHVQIFSIDSAGRPQFRQELPSPSNYGDVALEVADLNGDGRPDIIAASHGGIGIYFGGPGGTFPTAPSLALAGRPGPTVSGNFTGSGHADVAVLLPDSNAVEVVRRAADGTMSAASLVSVGRGPRAMVCTDMNGDGRDDLVIADSLDSKITILTQRPDHTWQRDDYPAVANMHWLAVGDLDQDGRPDVVTQDRTAGNVYVMHATATGLDAPWLAAASLVLIETGILADLDGDGDPDLMLVEQGGPIRFLAGAAGFAFTPEPPFWGSGGAYWVTGASVFSWDQDTWPDALVSSAQGYSIVHRAGPWSYNGGGWWPVGNADAGGEGTNHIALADLDGDGWTDFAATQQGQPAVVTFRRNPDAVFDQNVWEYGFGETIPDQCLLADMTGDGQPDLVVTDPDSRRLWVAPHVPAPSTGVVALAHGAVAARVAFAGSAPNPTRDSATLRFELPGAGRVRLEIADVRGRIVRRLLDRDVAAGSLSTAWDGRDDAGTRVGPGIYFARLVTPQGAASGKLVVL